MTDPGVVSGDPCEQCLPWPAPASGHGCSPWWSRAAAAAAACGNLPLLPEACLGKRHRGNSEQGAVDRLSVAPKGLAALGSELEDSKDVSLSSVESQQTFAGICPSLLTCLPLGQLWLLFPVELEQRMSWEHTGIKPPWSLCQGRVAVPAALPAPVRPCWGLETRNPDCSHPIPPAAPRACRRGSSNEASNALSHSLSHGHSRGHFIPGHLPNLLQPSATPQPLPSSASHPLLPSLCSWIDQLLLLPSPTASPTACSDIQALFNVCFAARKCSLVAGDGEGTT